MRVVPKKSLHYLGSSRIVSSRFVGFGKSPTNNVYLYCIVYIAEKRFEFN